MGQATPVRRLAVEGAVIVFSILLAFGVDAWWDQRQAQAEELGQLVAVQDEAEGNRLALDNIVSINVEQRNRLDRFFRASAEELAAVAPDSVGPWIAHLVIPWTFDAELSSATSLLGTPRSGLPRGREARRLLSRWVQLLKDADEEKDAMRNLANEAAGLVAAASTAGVSDGLERIYAIAARQGPSILTQMRGDPAFLAATMSMAQQQYIYLVELEAASSTLDSLRSVLRAGSGR